MPDALVLHGSRIWTSPYVFSAFVALKEKGLPFEMRLLDSDAGEHRRPPYSVESIAGRFPALRHGTFWLAESSAIDEYLEEIFPPPGHARLYPAEPRARAWVRMVQACLRSDLGTLRSERTTDTLFRGLAPKPFTPEGRADAERLVSLAERFLPPGAASVAPAAPDGPPGGPFCIADADLALMLHRLVANGDPCPPRLADYARAVFRRPAIREWLSHTQWRDR